MTWNSSTPWNVCTTSILSFCKPPRCPISLPIFLSQKIRLPTVANVDSHRFWWGTFFKWFLTTYKAWALMAYQKCGENGTRWMETAVSRKAERRRRARKVISQDRHPESPKKTSATLRAPSVPAHTPGSGLKPCRRLTLQALAPHSRPHAVDLTLARPAGERGVLGQMSWPCC